MLDEQEHASFAAIVEQLLRRLDRRGAVWHVPRPREVCLHAVNENLWQQLSGDTCACTLQASAGHCKQISMGTSALSAARAWDSHASMACSSQEHEIAMPAGPEAGPIPARPVASNL